MPCSNGTRKGMEEARRRKKEEGEERARYEKSAEGRHWRWLVDQLRDGGAGFTGLSEPNQRYFAVTCLSNEVHGGGFSTYFHNSSSSYHAHALSGLEEMEETILRQIVVEAQRLVFGLEEVSSDWALRRERMYGQHEELSEEVEAALDPLDRAFCLAKNSVRLQVSLENYAEKHNLYATF